MAAAHDFFSPPLQNLYFFSWSVNAWVCGVSWGVLACSPQGSLGLRCLHRKQLAALVEVSMLVPGSLSFLYCKFVKNWSMSREEIVDLVKTKSLRKVLSGLWKTQYNVLVLCSLVSWDRQAWKGIIKRECLSLWRWTDWCWGWYEIFLAQGRVKSAHKRVQPNARRTWRSWKPH